MNRIHVSLDEADFAKLVRGEVVQKPGSLVTIYLADIGWDRMYFHIELALREANKDTL